MGQIADTLNAICNAMNILQLYHWDYITAYDHIWAHGNNKAALEVLKSRYNEITARRNAIENEKFDLHCEIVDLRKKLDLAVSQGLGNCSIKSTETYEYLR